MYAYITYTFTSVHYICIVAWTRIDFLYAHTYIDICVVVCARNRKPHMMVDVDGVIAPRAMGSIMVRTLVLEWQEKWVQILL